MENTYFKELEDAGRAFEEKREAFLKKKEQIIEEKGWDSEELKAWYEEKKAMTFPYTDGEVKAYRAWRFSTEEDKEELELDDFLWDREVADFAKALRKAGIKTFIYTNTSTALMENIHHLATEGITLEGLATVEKKNYFCEGGVEKRPGLRFKVN